MVKIVVITLAFGLIGLAAAIAAGSPAADSNAAGIIKRTSLKDDPSVDLSCH